VAQLALVVQHSFLETRLVSSFALAHPPHDVNSVLGMARFPPGTAVKTVMAWAVLTAGAMPWSSSVSCCA